MPDTKYVQDTYIDLDTAYGGLDVILSLIRHSDQLSRYCYLKTFYYLGELQTTQVCHFYLKKLASILYVPT